MKFALTFNLPAVRQLFDLKAHEGIKVKVENGQILFKPVEQAKGAGVFALFNRTRGGIGIELTGKAAEEFVKKTGLERGSHMVIHQATYGWLIAEPVGAPGEKPSKLLPCARLWREKEELVEKAERAPAVEPEAPKQASRRGRRKIEAVVEQPKKRGRKSAAEKAAAAA
jgi:hypothetical protein